MSKPKQWQQAREAKRSWDAQFPDAPLESCVTDGELRLMDEQEHNAADAAMEEGK